MTSEQRIGQCLYCRHYRPKNDPLMTSCKKRGDINRTFSLGYHECFEARHPKQTTLEDGA